jgi:group I intron endonuclease
MNSGIYIIINPFNKRYIGSSVNINKRWNRYKNLSCKNQKYLYNSLKKYGYKNHFFKVLKYCEKNELFFWERFFGDIYLASSCFENGLNLILPSYDDIPQKRSKEVDEKISKIQIERFKNKEERLKTSESTKKGFTPEVKKRLSEIHTKRWKNENLLKEWKEKRKKYFESEESRKKASKIAKKYWSENIEKRKELNNILVQNSIKTKEKRYLKIKQKYIDNPNLRIKKSEELKKYYINNPQARLAASEKTKKQFSDISNHPASKKVINIITGEIYPCSKVVANMINVPPNTFRNWLRGVSKNKSDYKYL